MLEVDVLKALHTSELDAMSGYETAIEKADNAETKSIFEEAISLHRRGHEVIHEILAGLGEQPDETGSFMASVHKAVITVRSAFSGLDASSLNSFADGEQRIADAYEEASRQTAGESAITDRLAEREKAVRALLAKMKARAAQPPL